MSVFSGACRPHLFSGHRQHAAALLHPDWLVLGPRAERSRTQAAEQVESQDRRGQRSPQGQTGGQTGSLPAPIGAESHGRNLGVLRAAENRRPTGRPTLTLHLRLRVQRRDNLCFDLVSGRRKKAQKVEEKKGIRMNILTPSQCKLRASGKKK
ncbi:hypothetical protein EYF80_067745 [Liparis tanakae]|uniref:Uncharacterized protein n=1 Tax=Liparis tanakae TaxID=230148 RepID=A0A4Z2E189_9TELE|nr:hypothetical protein EYF80_067745 [Liparis tanakae]